MCSSCPHFTFRNYVEDTGEMTRSYVRGPHGQRFTEPKKPESSTTVPRKRIRGPKAKAGGEIDEEEGEWRHGVPGAHSSKVGEARAAI